MSKQKKIKDCPAWLLDVEGQRCWRTITKQFKGRALNEVEYCIIAGLCQEWSIYIRAAETIGNGVEYLIEDAHGLASIGSNAYRNFLSGCVQLGLAGKQT